MTSIAGIALVEELDKLLLVQLRDGRKLVGILRSFDQFANLVLERCVERVIVGVQYAEVHLGLHVVRGENVVLLGAMLSRQQISGECAAGPACLWLYHGMLSIQRNPTLTHTIQHVVAGEIDESRDPPEELTLVTQAEIKQAQRAEAESQQIQRTMQQRLAFLNDFD